VGFADPDNIAKNLARKAHKIYKKTKKKEVKNTMTATDQLTADDYITPYVDDDDSDDEK
jgi:hypothetical protein